MSNPFRRPSRPDNSAQIRAAQEQARLAREQEERAKQQAEDAAQREELAKDQQRRTQDEIIEGNKARRRRAFQRFSLLLVGDDQVSGSTPSDTTVG